MVDFPQEYTPDAIMSANIIEKFKLTREQYNTIVSKVPILPDSTTVHYPPYTKVCCIVVAIYSLHVEVNPSF